VKAGHDCVVVNDETSHAITLAGNLLVKLADGDDCLTIGDFEENEFTVLGTVTVEAGKGSDLLRVDELNVGGKARFDTSDGFDLLEIDNRFSSETKAVSQFGADLEITMGLHSDGLSSAQLPSRANWTSRRARVTTPYS
jgi:hypothetical protein